MAILLGQAGPGVDSANSNGAGTAFGQRLQASATGTVTRIAFKAASSPGVTSIHGAIYADNAGALSSATRLSEDFVFSGAPTAGWMIFTLATPVNVTSGSFYWIEFLGIGSALNYTDFATTGGTERDTTSQTVCPATHATTTGSNANIPNVYGDDFGAAGVGPVPSFTSPAVNSGPDAPAGFFESQIPTATTMEAIHFDGADDWLRGTGQGAMNGNLTVAAIVRRERHGSAAYDAIVGGASSGSVRSWMFAFNPTGAVVDSLTFYDGTSNSEGTTAPVNDGEWLLVAVTKATGTATPRFHIKNLSQNTAWIHENGNAANVNPPSLSGGYMKIGNFDLTPGTPGSAEEDFLGHIGLVGLWDGTVLTDAQIETLSSGYQTSNWQSLSPSSLTQMTSASPVDLQGLITWSPNGTTFEKPPGTWLYDGTASATTPANLSGTAAGVGAVTATLTAASLMTGTADGVGSVAASLTASSRMSSTAGGVGSAAGTLSTTPQLSGTAAGVGTATGTLSTTPQLSGTAAGIGSVAATLTATALMSGTAAGIGSVAANLTATSLMSGTAAGIGGVTGQLTASSRMSGTAAGIGGVTGILTAASNLTGTAAGIGGVTGQLTATALMSGTAAGIGGVTGLLTASSRMSGTAAGIGAVNGLLTASSLMSGTAAGIGAVSATLTASGTAALSGTAAGIGAVAATLTASSKLTGTAAGIGTVTAALTATSNLTGAAAGVGSAAALLTASSLMSGTAAGIGSAAGTLRVTAQMSGTAAGIGSVSAVLISAVSPNAIETLLATIVPDSNIATITADGLTDVLIDAGTDVTFPESFVCGGGSYGGGEYGEGGYGYGSMPYGLRTAAVVDTMPNVTIDTPHETATVAGPHNTALIAHS